METNLGGMVLFDFFHSHVQNSWTGGNKKKKSREFDTDNRVNSCNKRIKERNHSDFRILKHATVNIVHLHQWDVPSVRNFLGKTLRERR